MSGRAHNPHRPQAGGPKHWKKGFTEDFPKILKLNFFKMISNEQQQRENLKKSQLQKRSNLNVLNRPDSDLKIIFFQKALYNRKNFVYASRITIFLNKQN